MSPILNKNKNKNNKPLHVVMFPWLAMGHILPYFEVAKILAQKGHTITFINTPKNIDHMPKTPKSLQPLIKFVRLPLPRVDQLPEGAESTMEVPLNKQSYLKLAYDGLKHEVTKILKTSKPDWVFYDFASSWLGPISKSLNIPCAHYTVTPSLTKCFFDPPKDKKNITDFKIEDICGPPKWLPFETTIHLKPFEVVRAYTSLLDESGKMPDFDLNQAYKSCDMLLVRTSRELEGEWLEYVTKEYNDVPVVPLGLLPPLMQINDDEKINNDEKINDDEKVEKNSDWMKIKTWLDSKESSSVLFIGLGSELKLNQQDLTELAHGIELSGLPFFWALRTLKEGISELPEGFEDRTKDHGMVWKTWAPQHKILGHESIGGCVTHCGCSSVIEMLHFEHVLVTLPYYLDQCLLSRLLVEKKVALEVPRSEEDGSFTRDSVAQTLRLAIVDEDGSGCRDNAKEMGKVVSSIDLHDQYIDDFIDALQKYRVHFDN